MKKKLFIAFLIAVCSLLFAVSAFAMEIKDEYIAENGDYEMHWVYGDSAYVHSGNGATNIAMYEATYLSTDGTTKDGVFYVNTSTYNGVQLFNKLYAPSDYDFTQLTILPDVYVAEDGTTRNLRGFSGENNIGTDFYTYTEYAGDTTFNGTVLNDGIIEAFAYSKYTYWFPINTFSNFNSLKTVTYNGKDAVEGTLFISPTVTEINQGAFGANSNNTANNIKVLYFEDRGEGYLSIGKWSFARGIVEKVVFESGEYGIATNDTIGYFYISESDKTFTLKEVVICSGANVSTSIGTMVGSYTTVFVGTEEQYNEQKSNFSGYTPTVFDVCYLTGHEMGDYDIAYDNGYTAQGTSTSQCTHEGCTVSDVKTLKPIFTPLGYSVKDDGTALMGGFDISTESLNAYNEYAEKNDLPKISYGIIMSNANGIKIENGVLTSDFGIQLKANGNDYSRINYTVADFKAESSLVNLDLVIMLYVEENGEITLIQASTKKSTASANVNGDSISVNTISLKTVVDMTIENLTADINNTTDALEKEKLQALIDTLKVFSIE